MRKYNSRTCTCVVIDEVQELHVFGCYDKQYELV